MHYGKIISELPIQEAKFIKGEITSTEYEDYLLSILSDCATITERLGDSEEINQIKEFVWLKMDFTT